MIKKITFFLAFMPFLLFIPASFGQNVTITPSGITPAASGDLPRLTYEEILELPSPSVGDMAIDMTYKTLRFFNGKDWAYFLTASNEEMPILAGYGFKGDSTEAAVCMDFDSQGNVILGGIFTGTLLGAGDTIHVASSEEANYGSAFLMKVSTSGQIIYSRIFDGSSIIRDIRVGALDEIFITGEFKSSVQFSPSITVSSLGEEDVFVAKLNANGEAQWVQTVGGTGADAGRYIRIDDSGDIVIAGEFRGVCSFGSFSLTSNGGRDLFIARYRNSDGKLTLYKGVGGTGNETVKGFEIKTNGNYSLAGIHYGTITIGSDTYTIDAHLSHFIAELNSVSNAWEGSFVMKTGDSDFSFTLDSLDNFLISGVFEDSLVLNGTNIADFVHLNNEWLFVTKIDVSESKVWLQTFQCEGAVSIGQISIEEDSQDIYINAVLNGGSVEFYDGTFRSRGIFNSFLSKFSNSGQFQWHRPVSQGIDQIFVLKGFEGYMFGTGVFVNDIYLGNSFLEASNYHDPNSDIGFFEYDLFLFRIQD